MARTVAKERSGPSNPAGCCRIRIDLAARTDSKSSCKTSNIHLIANKRTYEGGWSAEVTVRELLSRRTPGRVNMRLTAVEFGVALAHGRRMGHHALRKRTDYANRSDGKSFVADVGKMIFGFFRQGSSSIRPESRWMRNSCSCR